MYTPRGIKGAILANIHTNHGQFLKHISESVNVWFLPFVNTSCNQNLKILKTTKKTAAQRKQKDQRYLIRIPHAIKEIDKVEKRIRIKHGNIHSCVPPLIVERKPNSRHPDHVSFTVDRKYVNIYTNHFSGFIVTVEDIRLLQWKCICSDVWVFEESSKTRSTCHFEGVLIKPAC